MYFLAIIFFLLNTIYQYKNKLTISAILISLFAQMQAIGLLGIAIPLNLSSSNLPVSAIGPIMAMYSIGLIIGCFQGKKFILTVGHIRAFAGFAALASTVALCHNLSTNLYINALLRLCSGISAAVMLIVIESWLATFTNKNQRGGITSLHQVTFYLAMGSGQLLVNISDSSFTLAFTLAAILCSFSLIPTTLVNIKNPNITLNNPMSIKQLYISIPGALAGAFCAGTAIGTLFNLIPIYLKNIGTSTLEISIFMSVLVLSGALLQNPIAKLSDRLGGTTILCALLLIASIIFSLASYALEHIPLPAFAALLGSVIACIYPTSVTTAYQQLPIEKSVAASSGLLIAYALGGFIGPIAGSTLMQHINSNAIFTYTFVISIAIFLLILSKEVKKTTY